MIGIEITDKVVSVEDRVSDLGAMSPAGTTKYNLPLDFSSGPLIICSHSIFKQYH